MVSQAFRDMIVELLPSQSEQDNFFNSFQQPLKKSLSINRHRQQVASNKRQITSKDITTNNQDLETFEKNNPDFILSQTPFFEFEDTKYVDRDDTTLPLWKTRQHLTGQFYIQEVAAALPANILKWYLQELSTLHSQPLTILDLCAAPGGKTAQLADYLLKHNIPGIVRGNDVDAKRLSTWATNIQRCGLYNTVASKLDGSQIGNLYPEFFDAILVDAPCSGEGTGFKSDAAYKRRTQESINKIVGLQEHIVTSAIKACKVWGLVIYSTCTLNPFENEIQIKKLLEKYGDVLEILPIEVENKSEGIVISDKFWVLSWQETSHSTLNTSHFLRARPHIHHTGWFFVCVMRKKSSTLKPLQTHITHKKQSSLLSGKYTKAKSVTTPYSYNKQTENNVKKILKESFGIELDLNRYAIIEWKHKLNLTDASVRELVTWSVWFQECGIPILKPTGKTFSLEHEIALTLGHLATKNTIELTEDELQRYCLWEDIYSPLSRGLGGSYIHEPIKEVNGYYILTHNWLWVAIGKVIDNMIKNKFFKW